MDSLADNHTETTYHGGGWFRNGVRRLRGGSRLLVIRVGDEHGNVVDPLGVKEALDAIAV